MLTRELKRRANRFFIPALSICLMVYFLYHLIQGGRGIMALGHLETMKTQHQTKRDQLAQEKDFLSKKVSLLKPGHISADLLEERAKAVLGFSRPNEQVVFIDDLHKDKRRHEPAQP